MKMGEERYLLQKLASSSALQRHPRGLYDPAHEKDSCGVGMIADIGGTPSRSPSTPLNPFRTGHCTRPVVSITALRGEALGTDRYMLSTCQTRGHDMAIQI